MGSLCLEEYIHLVGFVGYGLEEFMMGIFGERSAFVVAYKSQSSIR